MNRQYQTVSMVTNDGEGWKSGYLEYMKRLFTSSCLFNLQCQRVTQ